MRRAPAEVRKIDPDPVFRSVLVSQVVNKVLWKGKKSRSRKIVYDALELVERRAGQDPITVLNESLDGLSEDQRSRLARKIISSNFCM